MASYNYWTVLEELPRECYPSGQTQRKVLARCRCGTERPVLLNNLICGKSTSCGCHNREITIVHGWSQHPLYKVWYGMHERCYSPESVSFHSYGGRGIIVCQRWHDIENFIADNIKSYKNGLTLDRIDNDGNYEPSNCKWATRKEQAHNRRTNRYCKVNGIRMIYSDAARQLGFTPRSIALWLQKEERVILGSGFIIERD